MLTTATYIWLDGAKPTKQLRSKTRVVKIEEEETVTLNHFPDWSFDGSSTSQAVGKNSDLCLVPVNFVIDPLSQSVGHLVLCEVFHACGTAHESNTRAQLRDALKDSPVGHNSWIGFEQEYTLFKDKKPLGWPEKGSPPPQGPYYCGTGYGKTFGRNLVESHMEACLDAGIMIFGTNAEVMLSQWEFQLGYRGIEGEKPETLEISDQLWLARYLLCQLADDFEITVSFDNKPVSGDWNGAGCHANFSTELMRSAEGGLDEILRAAKTLEGKHPEHIEVYGHGLSDRLTGKHETSAIDEFHIGVADRTAAIRIPHQVQSKGYGYFEDRRPGANCDPYLVSARMLKTIFQLDNAELASL
jgi:glutamine synthetase